MPEVKREWIIERQGKPFVIYAGLLELAHAEGLSLIETEVVVYGNEQNGNFWMFKATVQTSKGSFTKHGDASPTNVSPQMRTVLPRMAETRAVARALRDAVNVGMASIEEMGDDEPVAQQQVENTTKKLMDPVVVEATTPASEKQINAVFGIAKSLGWDTTYLKAITKQRFGAEPDNMSGRQASNAITWMRTLRPPEKSQS